MQERQITFSELRNAYLSVKQIAEYYSGENSTHYKNKIEQDLGMYGDDNYYFLEDFVEKYQLSFEEFDYSQYFLSEGELAPSGFTIILIFLLIPLILLNVLILGVVKLFSPKFHKKVEHIFIPNLFKREEYRPTLDLTIGDLVASLTEKKFTLKSSLKYVLVKRNH